MKRFLTGLLTVCYVSVILSGCGQIQETAEISSAVSSGTSEPQEEEQPYQYTFQPHVLASVYKDAYGEEFEPVFYAFCDAALEGEQEFACPDQETLYRVLDVSRECLPVAWIYLDWSDCNYENGIGEIGYSIEKEEYLKKVDDFKKTVADWITENVKQNDDDLEKTLSLYYGFTRSISYDYEALEEGDDEIKEVHLSPYRTLMERIGICQEFAGAYAYLLLQVGVDATTCSSLNRSFTDAHEWNLVVLGGKYYYLDPTFECITSPGGLQYFGMTGARRDQAGDFDPVDYNIASTNILWGKDFPAEDERFAPLWKGTRFELDRKNQVILYYTEDQSEQAVWFSYQDWEKS